MPGLQIRPAGTPRSPGGDSPYAVTVDRPGPGRRHELVPVLRSVLAHDSGARCVVLVVGLFAVTTVCRVADLDLARALAILLAVLGAGCLTLPVRWAVTAGVCTWGFLTGFVVNAAGQLTFTDGDLLRAALLLTLATTASLAAEGLAVGRRERW